MNSMGREIQLVREPPTQVISLTAPNEPSRACRQEYELKRRLARRTRPINICHLWPDLA